MFTLQHWMFKIKKFFSLSALLIGGLIGASLFTHFSVAQNYGPTNESLLGRSLRFLMPDRALYLFAVIEPNIYTVHFDGNGSTSGSMGNMPMIYGRNENLLPNNFVKDGFIFKGWSRTRTGVVEYLDQEKVENLSIVNGGDVILYAQREGEVPYTVEYYLENLDGTYDRVGSDIMYGIEGSQVPLTSVTYTGFTLQPGAEVSVTSGGVVQYRYTRNTYNLTVKDRDNVLINTGIKYGADVVLPASDPVWTGNAFSGWDNLPADGKMPADNLVVTSSWIYGVHSITFDTDGGTEVPTITGNYGDPVIVPLNPTKTGYEFVGWAELPSTVPYEDIVVVAIWKEIVEDKSSGWSGGGGRRDSSDEPTEDQHGSAVDQTSSRPNMEVLIAYMRAHKYGILNVSRKNSDPDGYVTRGAMAEMVVRFTEKVLERKIPTVIPEKCHWGDAESEWKSPETKAYAEKACALGVMGIRMVDFMPNKILDRAEFGTILSRLLWGDKYDVVNATRTNLYYTKHLEALNKAGIMKQIDNPESKKELRKWAWLMLMRSRLEKGF